MYKKESKIIIFENLKYIVGLTLIYLFVLFGVDLINYLKNNYLEMFLINNTDLYIPPLTYFDSVVKDLLTLPLTVSYINIFINLIDNEKPKITELFRWYKKNVILKVYSVNLVAIVLQFILNVMGKAGHKGVDVLIIPVIFGLITALLFLTNYMLIKKPTLSVIKIYKLSVEKMLGKIWRLFFIDITFIPWYIIPIVIYVLLNYHSINTISLIDFFKNSLFTVFFYGFNLFIAPYYNLVLSFFALNIIEKKPESVQS